MQLNHRAHSLKSSAPCLSVPPHLKLAVFTAPVAIYTLIQSLLTGLTLTYTGSTVGAGTWLPGRAVAFPRLLRQGRCRMNEHLSCLGAHGA